MLEFKSILPEDSLILDQQFLKADQAGAADEPRDTLELARKYERARPVVIYDGEVLIAFLVYEALDDDNSTFLIWDFVVHREHQGKGHGYAIMSQLAEHLKADFGAERIELAIVPGNTPARNLYLKLGFRENGKVNSDGELEMEMAL